jgi:hypothetical protein
VGGTWINNRGWLCSSYVCVESMGTGRRVSYGLLACLCGAFLAVDATLKEQKYPLLQLIVDGHWIIVRDFIFTLCSLGAAGFGYLAANVKE